MEFDFTSLPRAERAALTLRTVYRQAGCQKYRMSRFEEYGLYQENRSFLSSEQLITFTDLDGRLLALKPDVTLSIAKSARPAPGQTLRYYYNESVYRPSAESHTFREISQMGVELISARPGNESHREAVTLALQSLACLGEDFVLQIGHMGYCAGLLDVCGVPQAARPALLAALQGKNAHQLREKALAAGVSAENAERLCGLLALRGNFEQTAACAAALAQGTAMQQAAAALQSLCDAVAPYGGRVQLDFSLCGEMEYYNGLVLQGYLPGLPRPVLMGGQYDRLMQKFMPGAGAIGFAVYLDELARLDAAAPAAHTQKPMLNVALPKGRLGDKVYALLARMGYGCEEDYNATRKLVVENPAAGIRYFLVKPSDVAIYVAHGAADVGIVGKDILEEAGGEADVYELLDTQMGKCRMCVAAPEGYVDDPGRPVRVATKFVEVAKRYYASIGREIDIIKLNGSIELAPILGLSDVIVDIVETGTTLKENGLKVFAEFMPISARFIANKAGYQFKAEEIDTMLRKLREVLCDD